MNKKIIISALVTASFLTGCKSEFNTVYKSDNWSYKYEYAKEQYALGKNMRAISLFGDMVNIMKGTENGEECLYLYGMSCFNSSDYESAADIFRKYITSYPKGKYTEYCYYYIGESLYNSSPEIRLDQTNTYSAIKAYQDFMDINPYSALKDKAQERLYELQNKLVEKEYLNAKLYYNLGTYFGNCTSGGNNYEACIITAQNALKDYPYTSLRENFASLIMKSKFQLAEQSIEAKRFDRYQDAEDECYGFINEYPDSKDRSTAEKYINRCKKITTGNEGYEE